MARQAQGNTMTISLIVAVALWLGSTVFLVILYTGQQELIDEANRAKLAKDKAISTQEERSLEIVKTAKPSSEGGPTVAGLLEKARSETAELATGTPSDDSATVRSKRDQLIQSIKSDGLVDDARSFDGLSLGETLTRLYSSYSALHKNWRESQDGLASLEAEMAQIRDAGAASKNACDETIKKLSDQMAQVEADRAKHRKERDEAVAQLEKEFEQGRQQNTELLTKERQDHQSCEKNLADSQERFASLRERVAGLLPGPEELSTARKPDGKVLTAVPGDDVVYINLGKRDRLTLGLQFAVYSAETGIPADGRAKAQIEVVAISDSSAEARILNVARTSVILEGDLIANPVFDPARPLSFVVRGDFDLDRDGSSDRDGAATMESLIKQWGGVTTDDLTPLTDFVILGHPPRRPKAAADVRPDEAEANRLVEASWNRYMDDVETIRSLAIPVMTQDVFLNFMGQHSRMSRR